MKMLQILRESETSLLAPARWTTLRPATDEEIMIGAMSGSDGQFFLSSETGPYVAMVSRRMSHHIARVVDESDDDKPSNAEAMASAARAAAWAAKAAEAAWAASAAGAAAWAARAAEAAAWAAADSLDLFAIAERAIREEATV